MSKESGQGRKEFLTEIQLLSRYKHPNIVSLIGFCDQGDEKILIYEYAEHGSLDTYLRGPCTFTWKQRINICIDAACGLDHLHNHVSDNHRVIHRDIKSGNILLGHNWKAMIADLGLSKIGLANENDSCVVTHACGTDGYLDPEYRRTGILTKESDIYSFGVVLFEVLCGRLSYMNVPNNQRYLDQLARCCYEEHKLDDIIDPSLKNQIDSNSLFTYSKIAYECLFINRPERPAIATVVQRLKDAMKFQDDMDKGPKLTNYEGIKDDVTTNPIKKVLINMDTPLLDSIGVGENTYERKAEAMSFLENWIPISLPEFWNDNVTTSNQSKLSVVTNLVAIGARDSKGVLDEIFWEHVGITVNILRIKKSDYNRGQLHLLDDLLIKCFSVVKKLLNNDEGGFGDSYMRHWVAVVELYKEVTGCAEDASGRLLYESVACIRLIISSVLQRLKASKATKHAKVATNTLREMLDHAKTFLGLQTFESLQHLKASKAIKHDEVATNTLREMLDHAKALRVIDDLLSCLVTCGKSLMSGSSNFLRAACEACEAIWSLIDAFEIQSTKEYAPLFLLSSMYSHSSDQINIKEDERGPLMGTDYENIMEVVTQEFLRSDDIRVAIFYCLRQRLEASWSSVIQIILRCCVYNDSVGRVLFGISNSSVVGGGGDNTIISEVFSLISLCTSFDTDPQPEDSNSLKSKVSDPSDLVLNACLLIASVAQSIDNSLEGNTAVIMLTSSPETQHSRLSDLAHHYSLCNGLQNFRPHSMSAMLALACMCSLENNEPVATSIRKIAISLFPSSATLCDYLRMSITTGAQGDKFMLSYWHGIRDGCVVLLCFRLYWGEPLAIQDLGGCDIPQSLIDLLGNKQHNAHEIGLSPFGVEWTICSLRWCLKGGSSVFRQVFLTSENVKILCDLISDVHLKLLRYWVGPGGGKIGVKGTIDQVVYLLGFPFVASEESSEFQGMDSAGRKDMLIEIKASMDKYIQILLEVGLPGQIIKCLEHLELKDTETPGHLLAKMVEHRSLVVELVGKGILNPKLMERLLDDSSPTNTKVWVLQIISGVADMDKEFYKQIEGANILRQLKAFLTHEDPIVSGWTCNAIAQMCKHSSYFYSLLANHNISSLLVELLFNKDNYPQRAAVYATSNLTKRNVAICLDNLSYHSDKLSEDMISKGAMEALLTVVADYSVFALDPNRPLYYTLHALATMCKHQPCRHFIRSSDAYSIIGQLRESPDEDIASYSTLIFNRASEETSNDVHTTSI